jgi:hypothetical protein
MAFQFILLLKSNDVAVPVARCAVSQDWSGICAEQGIVLKREVAPVASDRKHSKIEEVESRPSLLICWKPAGPVGFASLVQRTRQLGGARRYIYTASSGVCSRI